jgi:hypothetical protein
MTLRCTRFPGPNFSEEDEPAAGRGRWLSGESGDGVSETEADPVAGVRDSATGIAKGMAVDGASPGERKRLMTSAANVPA